MVDTTIDMASHDPSDIHNHGVALGGDSKKVMCSYCDKVLSCGFYRLKYHLAGIRGDVKPCVKVPDDVKHIFMDEIAGKNKATSDAQINNNHADALIGRLKGIITHQETSCGDMKGCILEDALNSVQKYVNENKRSWESTGCSILLDTWTDFEDRNLINILVNCPKGAIYLGSCDISTLIGNVDAIRLFIEDVIHGVGIKDVVQIVTSSTSPFMKEVGNQIMGRHKHIFWTIGVSTCIELMLERFTTIDRTKQVLEKAEELVKFIHSHAASLNDLSVSEFYYSINPSKMGSVVPYITLENILSKKHILETVFASYDWVATNLSYSPDGKRVADLVRSSSFWNEATFVMKASTPLLHELCLLHGNNKPQAGYIYERIDQLKETIQKNLSNKKFQCVPFWSEIDNIWNNCLHSPLHAAGYYLNPALFYPNRSECDLEIAEGLSACVARMGGEDYDVRSLIRIQATEYKTAEDSCITNSMNSPVMWWSEHERQYPELSRMAIRILSQTCDGASKFNLNRDLAEKLINEKCLVEKQRLAYHAFVHYNMQLQKFDSKM